MQGYLPATSAIVNGIQHAHFSHLKAGRRPICGGNPHMADAIAAARIQHLMPPQRPGEVSKHLKMALEPAVADQLALMQHLVTEVQKLARIPV